MSWDTVQGSWNEYKGKIREKWGKLTGDDLDKIAGKREQLLGRLQKAYGYAKEDAEREIKKFESDCDKSCPSH